jgi:hypothetical protein
MGGYWEISVGALDSYNAFCYAGNGCSILDNRLTNPFLSRTVEEMEEATRANSGGCAIGRVSDRSPLSDIRTVCKTTPTDGSVLICLDESTTSPVLYCGPSAILAIQARQPTQEQFVIVQKSDDGFFRYEQDISSMTTDGNCIIQGSKLTCAPGMTWLFVIPRYGNCDGVWTDVLGITCPSKAGFTRIGCCPVSDLSPVSNSAETPTDSPTDSPTEAPTDTQAEAPTDTPAEDSADIPTAAPTGTRETSEAIPFNLSWSIFGILVALVFPVELN